MTIPRNRGKLDAGFPRDVSLDRGANAMSMQIEIPEPLAEQVNQAAKSQAKSPNDFVLDAVQTTLANASRSESLPNGDCSDPLLGLLADDPELADFIENSAMHDRETRPLRTARD